MFALLVVTAGLAGIGATQSSPSVVVQDVQVDPGETADVTLALSEAPNGVAGFDLTVAVVEDSTATITGVQVDQSYGMSNKSIASDGASAYASGVDTDRVHEAGATDVPLLTVTVEGLQDGETPLDVMNVNIDNDDGNDVNADVEPGTVTVGDGVPETATPTGTATNGSTNTTATETAADGGGGGSGGGQSGSSGASGDTRVYDTDAGATVWFTDVSGAPTLSTTVSGASDAGVAVEGVSVNLKFSNDRFRAEVSDPTSEVPDSAPAVESATRYFSVDTYGLDWDNVEQVSLTVSVEESALPDGEVQLYHYADGEWRGLNTTAQGDGTFMATAESFSPFAVGSASEDTETATDSGSTATATATDDGDAAANETPTAADEGRDGGIGGVGQPLTIGAAVLLAVLAALAVLKQRG